MSKRTENNAAPRVEKHGPEPNTPEKQTSTKERRSFLQLTKKAIFVATFRNLVDWVSEKVVTVGDCQDAGDVEVEERTEFYEDEAANDNDP